MIKNVMIPVEGIRKLSVKPAAIQATRADEYANMEQYVSEACGQRPVLRVALAVFLFSFGTCMAQSPEPSEPALSAAGAGQGALIPDADFAALEVQLMQPRGEDGRPSVETRRALKNTARKGLEIMEKYPDAPNRFRLLGIIFRSQKQLLALENSEITRKALFETCTRMVNAPDEYALERLEADLLLSEKEMSEKNATLDERAQALAGIIERYRETTAESKSLLMAALIVQKLDAPDLEGEIVQALDERFSDDPEVIQFRREHLKYGRLDVVFKGVFERNDGTLLRFPYDTAGHVCLMVFWSKSQAGFEKYLEKSKEELARFPGLVDVYSFNLDELDDGGESILRAQGLDWTVMRLPEGRKSLVYQSYAQGDPVSLLVNEYGLSVIRTEIVHGRMNTLEPGRVSDARYSAQLQSLFIGDFLLPGQLPTNQQPTSSWQAIQHDFAMAPFRYRLKEEDALSIYTKTAALCAEAIQNAPVATEVPVIRNHRIIALLGMWNLACQPGYLDQAVTESKSALSEDLPPGADVVPRFCLAKAAIREDQGKAESVVTSFLKECGGENAPAAGLAAAVMLAIEAKSRELYQQYRAVFLEKYADSPELYSFAAFLNDRHHQYRLMKANHESRERSARGHIVAHGYPFPTNSLPDIALTTLDGAPLNLPNDTNGKLTYLLFIEPPAGGPTNDFPFAIDRNGKPERSTCLRSVMAFADDLTKSHVNKDINFVAAFLTDDAEHVRYLVATNGWTCQAAMVPGGLRNPMVRQLGLFSADEVPNVFLLRRDGTVAWHSSSLRYHNEFGFPFAILLGMKVQVEVCEVETAYEALAKGDYQEAARVFSGPFLPAQPNRFAWHAPRCHGRALACMQLKEWNKALESIDDAVMWHKSMHYRGMDPKRISDWPAVLADLKMDPPCDVLSALWSTRAVILDQLDRKEEAAAMRKLAEVPFHEDRPNVYKLFHDRLRALRLDAK